MRLFTATKVLVLFALLAANVPARSIDDPNCYKTCGQGSDLYHYTRSCTQATCWVTNCPLTSGLCQSGTTSNDTFNDFCSNQRRSVVNHTKRGGQRPNLAERSMKCGSGMLSTDGLWGMFFGHW